ncbi:hypothetical protein chiPu_0026862 [Chiloscyllium punctatum]|uniref:Uncharacterized protein n=1 Tax=Chiloscyllium punctatum TaxID=137246 RepID=A0A401TIL9_CHIPU|nr:hypothetical protein [Chiloscyllium punctatum]
MGENLRSREFVPSTSPRIVGGSGGHSLTPLLARVVSDVRVAGSLTIAVSANPHPSTVKHCRLTKRWGRVRWRLGLAIL